MEKISKSSLTPEQQREVEAIEAAAREKIRNKKCQHFKVGTGVIWNTRRYTINQIIDKTVILIAEDGSAHRVDNPYFLL